MKRLLVAAAALTLLSTAAFADTNPPPDGQAQNPPAAQTPAPGGPDGGPGGMGWKHHGWGQWGMGGPGRMMGGRFAMMNPPMLPSKGAHVVIERGRFGGRIDVKCADNDSTQDCLGAVETLLQQLPHGHHHGWDGGAGAPDAPGAPTTPAPAAPAQ